MHACSARGTTRRTFCLFVFMHSFLVFRFDSVCMGNTYEGHKCIHVCVCIVEGSGPLDRSTARRARAREPSRVVHPKP